MECAFVDTVELAWLEVLCLLKLRVNGRVEPGTTAGFGGVGCSTDKFVPDSMSTRRSDGIADWLKNCGPIWPGSWTLSFDPNVTE